MNHHIIQLVFPKKLNKMTSLMQILQQNDTINANSAISYVQI